MHDKKVHSVLAGLIERQGHQYGSVTKYYGQEQYPQDCELDSLQKIIENKTTIIIYKHNVDTVCYNNIYSLRKVTDIIVIIFMF